MATDARPLSDADLQGLIDAMTPHVRPDNPVLVCLAELLEGRARLARVKVRTLGIRIGIHGHEACQCVECSLMRRIADGLDMVLLDAPVDRTGEKT